MGEPKAEGDLTAGSSCGGGGPTSSIIESLIRNVNDCHNEK